MSAIRSVTRVSSNPAGGAGATHLLLWYLVVTLGWTLVEIPHTAMGAELSTDYDERSRITSVRESLATAGQVGILALLVVLAGVGVVAVAATAWSFPTVRNLERDVPDAVVDVAVELPA